MQPSNFPGVKPGGGKILKIVQVGNSNSNYVTLPQYNTYPFRAAPLQNQPQHISNDVLGSLLAQNQFNIAGANHVATPTLLSSNMVDNLTVSQTLGGASGGNVTNSSNINNSASNQQGSARKPCNCTKSHCLKLYCECFANGQLCDMCNCNNCMNNLNYEDERARAIKMTLDRNPTAFHPKIGRGEGERKHTKGCNCKRSGCLKNYCECYEAKISCTDSCRCQGCKNTEDSIERRSLKRLTQLSALKSSQPDAITKVLLRSSGDRMPHAFLTWDVIEGITNCMISKAEEIEARTGSTVSDVNTDLQERKLIDLVGSCLEKVINTSKSALLSSSLTNFTSNMIEDNHLDSSTTDAVLRNIGGDSNGRDVIIPRTDMDDEDDLDVDLEDTMVLNEDDDVDEDDDEIVYNRGRNIPGSMNRKKARLVNNSEPMWRTAPSSRHVLKSNNMRTVAGPHTEQFIEPHSMPHKSTSSRVRKMFDDDMLNT